MRNQFILLCLMIYPVSTFARYWNVQRRDTRPNLLRDGALLELMGMTALVSLLAGAVLLFAVSGRAKLAVALVVAGLSYDQLVRWFFTKREVYRLAQQMGRNRELAVKRVERRGVPETTSFVLPRLKRGPAPKRQPATVEKVRKLDEAW